MDALPAPRFQRRPFNPRKRRRADSAVGDGDSEGKNVQIFKQKLRVLIYEPWHDNSNNVAF